MPISFSLADHVMYLNVARQRQMVEYLMTAKSLGRDNDATDGELYRCMKAGSGFFDKIRGVVNVYVVSWIYQAQDGVAVDVRFHKKFYRVVFRDQPGNGRTNYVVTRIEQVAGPDAALPHHTVGAAPFIARQNQPQGVNRIIRVNRSGSTDDDYYNTDAPDEHYNTDPQHNADPQPPRPRGQYGIMVPAP